MADETLNSPTPEQLDTESDEVEAFIAKEEAKSAAGTTAPPTTLRDAANSRWVVVPKGFGKIITVATFKVRFDQDHFVSYLVEESILADPKLFDRFFSKFYTAYAEDFEKLVQYKSFDDVRWFDDPAYGDEAESEEEDFSSVGIHTLDSMKQAVRSLQKRAYLLQGHIPRQSITLMVGDSGIGKSPFNYELGISIASGLPFLGIPTTQGRVLYLDYEDDVDQIIANVEAITKKLKLGKPPNAFQFWSPAMSGSNSNPFDLIRLFRPDFVIIDTISAAFSKVESENKFVPDLYKQCRETGAAVEFVHHLKKESSDQANEESFDFDLTRPTTVRDFQCVRGASALYNNADLRLKLIRARANDEDWAFIVRGYLRGKGSIPTLSVGRVLDENGEPIGHKRLGGLAKLSAKYRDVFTALPERFRWKDLADHFKGNGSKQEFRDACIAAGLLKPEKDGDLYVKMPGWETS
jgi:hypothetical protein